MKCGGAGHILGRLPPAGVASGAAVPQEEVLESGVALAASTHEVRTELVVV